MQAAADPAARKARLADRLTRRPIVKLSGRNSMEIVWVPGGTIMARNI
jgi:hypothetical protein